MFLTTEPSISGRPYIALRVIFGVGSTKNVWRIAISQALGELEREANELEADGVIGVHLSTSETGIYYNATVMGTAIKFQQP